MFGESKNLCHEEAEKAESNRVKVLCPSSACTTMNEVRIELYLDKYLSLTGLPPTSSLQTHYVYSTLKRSGNGRFHVVSTWNPRGVFVGILDIWAYPSI